MNTGNNQNIETPDIEAELEAFLENETAGEGGSKNDLLSQIAAEDIENEKKASKKKQHHAVSFSKLFTVFLMRITLFIDSFNHKHTHALKILQMIWCMLTGLVYAGGICSLFILSYAYQRYPVYIQNFFETHNINLSSWNLEQYTLSRIVLTGLKDSKNTYSVQKMVIRSDFSDFLNKRIKSVTLDGVNIVIKETRSRFEIGYLAELLLKINQMIQTEYQIGSISVTNATAVLKGATFELPIQFSMTGFYEHNTSISIPLTVKQPYMNISGMLSVSGTSENMDWTLDILSGNLSFPNQQPENISGQIKLKTNGHVLSALNGAVDLIYGQNKKTIKMDLKDSQGLLQGTTDLSFTNTEEQNAAQTSKTQLNLNFDGLDIKNFSLVESQKPIRFNIQSLSMRDLNLTNASGTLEGRLTCRDFVCSYQVGKSFPVTIQSLKTTYQANTYTSKEKTSFTVNPNNRPNLILNGKGITLDLSLGKFSFNGLRNTAVSEIKLNAQNVAVFGKLGEKTKPEPIRIQLNELSYESPDIKLKNGAVSVSDIWQDIPDFQLSAKEVLFKNSRLFKVPLSLNATRFNGLVSADFSILNNTVQSKFNGTVNVLNGTFQGTFAVKPFRLQDKALSLNTISDLFPADIQNVAGNFALYGKINWKNEKQISGPFYLSLSDVDFDFGNMNVRKLNTVLMVQTLSPFTTASNQEIFIGEIGNSLIPLQNIHSVVKFDNQMARINTLSLQSLGITLGIDNVLLPYRSNSAVFYLKNPDVDLALVNSYWNVPDMTLSGNASVTLPLEFQQNMINLNNSEIKLDNVLLHYTGSDERIKKSLFAESSDYNIKSGNILLSQISPQNLDAYINFDGRLMPSQIKTLYKNTLSIEPAQLINPVPLETVPETIRQKQEQLYNATSE